MERYDKEDIIDDNNPNIISYCKYCKNPIYNNDEIAKDLQNDLYHRECYIQMNTIDPE